MPLLLSDLTTPDDYVVIRSYLNRFNGADILSTELSTRKKHAEEAVENEKQCFFS